MVLHLNMHVYVDWRLQIAPGGECQSEWSVYMCPGDLSRVFFFFLPSPVGGLGLPPADTSNTV